MNPSIWIPYESPMNPLWIPHESPIFQTFRMISPCSLLVSSWRLLHGARPGGSWSLDGLWQFMDKSHGKFTGVIGNSLNIYGKSPCHHHGSSKPMGQEAPRIPGWFKLQAEPIWGEALTFWGNSFDGWATGLGEMIWIIRGRPFKSMLLHNTYIRHTYYTHI